MRLKPGIPVIILLLSANIILGQDPSKPDVEILEEGFIFEEADFAQCHSSTLLSMNNGEVMAAWFGGTHERHPDVSIYTAKKKKSGDWKKPKKVANGVVNDTLRYPTWNPVLFAAGPDKIILFYKVGPSPAEWWGMYKTSDNFGMEWSTSTMLPENILGPVKNKPVEINNRIVSPSSTESKDAKKWRAHMEISDDGGLNWKKVPVDTVSNVKAIQPTLLKLDNGDLKALFRSDQNFVLESVSKDAGDNWSPLKRAKLPNPNSGIDAVTLANGMHLLVYNPTASGKDWSDGRHKLFLALSEDGINWNEIFRFEDNDKGEFSYPAIIQDNDGHIHVSYTYNREKIKYFKFKLNGI